PIASVVFGPRKFVLYGDDLDVETGPLQVLADRADVRRPLPVQAQKRKDTDLIGHPQQLFESGAIAHRPAGRHRAGAGGLRPLFQPGGLARHGGAPAPLRRSDQGAPTAGPRPTAWGPTRKGTESLRTDPG